MRITTPMFEKGRSFLMAAGLVKAYEGHRFVYLHLLCQGVENVGKAILLLNDYEKYGPQLKSPIGHDLLLLANEIQLIYKHSFLSAPSISELSVLNSFYKKHQLRYGDIADFDGTTVNLVADCLHSEMIGLLADFNTQFK